MKARHSLIKNLLFTTVLFLIVLNAHSQNYWQQEVHYTIHVKLDDVNHFLFADLNMRYVNHSPDELNIIWFHLWPNCYSNVNTEFAQQQLENKSTAFYFSDDDDKGFIDSLNFEVNGEKVLTEQDPQHTDMIKLILNEPLKSGVGINITTPFRVKIPGSFSRMGRVGQAYQITQWFPKPAVYDSKGWHPIPYLDQGEFYSEYGSFEVYITVPKNYVVGATGNLQNADEIKWLNALADSIKKMSSFGDDVSFPASSTATKTLHYTQNNVHDFAWFADKRYHVLKGSVELPQSHRTVTTWVMFTNYHSQFWKDAIPYVNHAVYDYSSWLGDYPYDNCTALQGALKAGGGMEYPTITVISEDNGAKSLDVVIAHEVGHNWLYGILGFNEREHPWMDEGINSYYENRYVEKEYPGSLLAGNAAKFLSGFQLNEYPRRYQNYLLYLLTATTNNDQLLDENAANFTATNYGGMVYSKTATVFQYLENYLGTNVFDSVMHSFYSQWMFKHPMPSDLEKIFNSETGKELDWCFNDLIETTSKLDYKLLGLDDTTHIGNSVYDLVHVKNTNDIKGPFVISGMKNGVATNSIWYNGFYGNMDVLFPKGDYDSYRIDPNYIMPEMNRQNNTIRTSGLFPKTEKLRIQFLGSIQNPTRTQLFFTPIVTWNEYDHLMPGLAFYNSIFPEKKVQFFAMPVYSISQKQLNGNAKISVNFFLKNSWLHAISFTSSIMQYTFYRNELIFIPYYSSFRRTDNKLSFDVQKKDLRSSNSNQFQLRYTNVTYLSKHLNEGFDLENISFSNYETLSFNHNNTNVLSPYSFEINIQAGQNSYSNPERSDFLFCKTWATLNYKTTYYKPKTGLTVRLFAGTFLGNSDGANSYQLFHMNAGTGLQDYLFDNIYLGRSEFDGLLSHQNSISDGSLKVRTDFTMGMGESEKWLMAINLRSTLPFKSPVFLFADAGVYNGESVQYYGRTMTDAGIGLNLFAGVVEIYSPLLFSSNIRENQLTFKEYDQWYERIMFTLNISKFNPFNILKQIGQ